jgi:hypothetical protein
MQDGENESKETQWQNVPNIAGEVFQQSVAVAQLAVKLCELDMAKQSTALLKQNLDPAKFLDPAWELIKGARDRVSREQTNLEYLVLHRGSDEAADRVVQRILKKSGVPFDKLCNKKETYTQIELHDSDTNTVIRKEWKVYTSEAGFGKLFWRYWNASSVIRDEYKRKECGEALLAFWKRDGLPPNDFLALNKFRREHDKRAENLKPKQKTKRRLPVKKNRKH